MDKLYSIVFSEDFKKKIIEKFNNARNERLKILGDQQSKEIEKRKRAQINLSCSTDTTHKGDGPWSNRTLQEVLKFRSG